MSNEKRLEFFDRPVEPTLQRELKHKGTVIGDGSYSAELIAYVEFYQNFHIILTYRLDRQVLAVTMCEHEKLTEGLQRPQRCCLRSYCSLKDNLDVVVQM